MHIGTMVEFAFALVGKLDVINKHSFNDFKLRIGRNRLHNLKTVHICFRLFYSESILLNICEDFPNVYLFWLCCCFARY